MDLRAQIDEIMSEVRMLAGASWPSADATRMALERLAGVMSKERDELKRTTDLATQETQEVVDGLHYYQAIEAVSDRYKDTLTSVKDVIERALKAKSETGKEAGLENCKRKIEAAFTPLPTEAEKKWNGTKEKARLYDVANKATVAMTHKLSETERSLRQSQDIRMGQGAIISELRKALEMAGQDFWTAAPLEATEYAKKALAFTQSQAEKRVIALENLKNMAIRWDEKEVGDAELLRELDAVKKMASF